MTLVAVAAADTTTTTGTGAVTLSGTAQSITINGVPATTFNTAFTLGGTISYPISNVGYQISDGTNTETGLGTLTGATTLTRDTILASSNGGRHVNFIAGTKTVVSATTAWNASEPTWTSVPKDTLPENDIHSGTFTGTITNGGAGTTGTVRYKVDGAGKVTLSFLASLVNASAGTTSVMTGLPAFLSPTSKTVLAPVVINGVTVLGALVIAAGATVQATGTITVQQSTGTSPIAFTGTVTTAQSNGIAATVVTYSLY